MAKNIEIKAFAPDLKKQAAIAASMCSAPVQIFKQVDVFFKVDSGRLKLRRQSDIGSSAARPGGDLHGKSVENNEIAQLIFYQRPSLAGPKLSDYHISDVADPEALTDLLGRAIGILAEVRKVRQLYLDGRTRIHFDTVADLGDFIELEVVLSDDESPADGEVEASRLMKALGIKPAQLIEVAYVDLLRSP